MYHSAWQPPSVTKCWRRACWCLPSHSPWHLSPVHAVKTVLLDGLPSLHRPPSSSTAHCVYALTANLSFTPILIYNGPKRPTSTSLSPTSSIPGSSLLPESTRYPYTVTTTTHSISRDCKRCIIPEYRTWPSSGSSGRQPSTCLHRIPASIPKSARCYLPRIRCLFRWQSRQEEIHGSS